MANPELFQIDHPRDFQAARTFRPGVETIGVDIDTPAAFNR